MRKLFLALLFVAPLFAQISQLATTADGATLLFRTEFRLQSETDLSSEAKIYKYQNRQFTRLGSSFEVNQDRGSDVFQPFVTSDGVISGWQIKNGCSACRYIIGSRYASAIAGVTLPANFPQGSLSISANGRFFVADELPGDLIFGPYVRNAKYFDSFTGIVTDLPLNFQLGPSFRAVANDGTVLSLLLDASPSGSLALWKPGSQPVSIYTGGRVLQATIGAENQRVAFEFLSLDPQRAGEHLLAVWDQTGTVIIPTTPGQPLSDTGVFQPSWDSGGTQLLYRDFDSTTQTYALQEWNAATQVSIPVLTHVERIATATLSGDGTVIWAVTGFSRLLRLNLSSGTTDEILPPLPQPRPFQISSPVPGSALLITGSGFNSSNTVSFNGTAAPVLNTSDEGIWVQVPWEVQSFASPNRVTVRAPDNPFEAVPRLNLTYGVAPQFVGSPDANDYIGYAKAAHQDFSSLVSAANPARAGETIHVYLTGLGPLDKPLSTGQPGPDAPPLHPLASLLCSLNNQPAQSPVLTYAPGLIGFYQADLIVPNLVLNGTSALSCEFKNSTSTSTSTADARLYTAR